MLVGHGKSRKSQLPSRSVVWLRRAGGGERQGLANGKAIRIGECGISLGDAGPIGGMAISDEGDFREGVAGLHGNESSAWAMRSNSCRKRQGCAGNEMRWIGKGWIGWHDFEPARAEGKVLARKSP